jgi:hypothetical protein
MKPPEHPLLTLKQLMEMLAVRSPLIPVTDNYYAEMEFSGRAELNLLYPGSGPIAEHMSSTLRSLILTPNGEWFKPCCNQMQ